MSMPPPGHPAHPEMQALRYARAPRYEPALELTPEQRDAQAEAARAARAAARQAEQRSEQAHAQRVAGNASAHGSSQELLQRIARARRDLHPPAHLHPVPVVIGWFFLLAAVDSFLLIPWLGIEQTDSDMAAHTSACLAAAALIALGFRLRAAQKAERASVAAQEVDRLLSRLGCGDHTCTRPGCPEGLS